MTPKSLLRPSALLGLVCVCIAAAACAEEPACHLLEADGSVTSECAEYADCALVVRGLIAAQEALPVNAHDACAAVALRAGAEDAWSSFESVEERALAACTAAAEAAGDWVDGCAASDADACQLPVVTCTDPGIGAQATDALELELAAIAATRCEARATVNAGNDTDCFTFSLVYEERTSCESDCDREYWALVDQYSATNPALLELTEVMDALVP